MSTSRVASPVVGLVLALAACGSSGSPNRPTDTGGGAGTGGSSGSAGGAGGNGGAGMGGVSATGGAAQTGGGGAGGGSGGTMPGTGGQAAGTGGAAGADAGGSDAATSRCAGLPFCDDFDSQTAGSPPAANAWAIIGGRTCSTQGTPWPITVDAAQSHSPPNSMKISGGDSCGPLMLNTSALAKIGGGEIYGRFWVRLSDTAMMFDHAFLMALGLARDAGAFNINDQGSYLQLASQGAGNATNVLMWQTNDGNILPNKNSMGGAKSTYPMANTWTCIEFHTSQATGALETWVNGTAVAGLTFVPNTTAKMSGVNDQWTAPSPFAPTSIGFGWTVFSGESLTIWFDDIAVAASRIGCP